jgi:hypothetical protein
VAAVKAWWNKQRSHFKPGLRYLYGQPRSADSLRTAPTWRRDIFALELVGLKDGLPKLNFRGWAKDQLERLRMP